MLKKIFGCFSVIAVCVIVLIGIALNQAYRAVISSPAKNAEEIHFEIEPGSSISSVADNLESENLVKSAFWFKVYIKVSGTSKGIQSGDFYLKNGMSYSQILNLLSDAESGDEISLTIPEGYTNSQIGELVISRLDITQEEWDLWTGVMSPLKKKFSFIPPSAVGLDLEGYLFPDTYRFFRDATVEDITSRLVSEMQKNYESLDISLSDSSRPVFMSDAKNVLTLASIIQREVRDPKDMAMVADIFFKRLDIGMALQADSTVNYITGKKTPGISLDDRDIDSPYNTYQYSGLPPGPISNPGLDAIKAVVEPTSNEYYYFLTTPEGEVIYAKTHDEHVQNKYRYLR